MYDIQEKLCSLALDLTIHSMPVLLFFPITPLVTNYPLPGGLLFNHTNPIITKPDQ